MTTIERKKGFIGAHSHNTRLGEQNHPGVTFIFAAEYHSYPPVPKKLLSVSVKKEERE